MRTIEEIQAAIDAAKAAGEDATELETELAEAKKLAKGTGTDPDKNEPTFTQAQVDEIVRKAKAAQKASHERALETLKEERDEAVAGKDKLAAILQKQMAAQLEKMPPATKKLLEKLDIVEQYDWLAENGSVQTPATPATPVTPRDSEGGGERAHELADKNIV